jgi:hypothetical protein
MAKRLTKLEKRIIARNKERDAIMERTAAVVALSNAHGNNEDLKFNGFMAIFHPNYSEAKLRELTRDIQARRK